jgi:hypothetical protein
MFSLVNTHHTQARTYAHEHVYHTQWLQVMGSIASPEQEQRLNMYTTEVAKAFLCSRANSCSRLVLNMSTHTRLLHADRRVTT